MVRDAYKQTEIGVIPVEWDVKSIGDVSQVKSGKRLPKGNFLQDADNGKPYLRVTDMDKTSVLIKQLKYVPDHLASVIDNYRIYVDDIFISVAGTLGIVGTIPESIDGAYLTENANRFTKITCNRDYLKYTLLSNYLQRKIWDTQTLGAQPKLALTRIREFLVPIPKTETEQKAIAEALSDVDALIESLEKLIAKKLAIKTATMQELITGDRKLGGFSNNRRLVSIGKDTILKARIGWQALTTAEYLDYGEYLLVTGTEFSNGKILWGKCHAVSKWRYEQDRNIQVKSHDVLVTKDGTIGKIGYVHEILKPATLNSGVFVVRPTSDKILSRYLYYTLRSKVFDTFLNKMTAGSTITHLYQKDFVTFEFEVPEDPEEQKAISMILTDMDEEIYELEGRLETTKNLKQGMMQELLTGRTRLV